MPFMVDYTCIDPNEALERVIATVHKSKGINFNHHSALCIDAKGNSSAGICPCARTNSVTCYRQKRPCLIR